MSILKRADEVKAGDVLKTLNLAVKEVHHFDRLDVSAGYSLPACVLLIFDEGNSLSFEPFETLTVLHHAHK